MRRIVQENGEKEMLVHAAALGLGLIYYGSMNQGLAEELFALIHVLIPVTVSCLGKTLCWIRSWYWLRLGVLWRR